VNILRGLRENESERAGRAATERECAMHSTRDGSVNGTWLA